MLFQKYHYLWFFVEKTHFGKHFVGKSDLFLLDHVEVFRKQIRNHLMNRFLYRNQISHQMTKKMDGRCFTDFITGTVNLLTNGIFFIVGVVILKKWNLFEWTWQSMLPAEYYIALCYACRLCLNEAIKRHNMDLHMLRSHETREIISRDGFLQNYFLNVSY